MPNWCSNTLMLEGSNDTIQQVLEFIKGDKDQIIDFEKIIPVPLELSNSNAYIGVEAQRSDAEKTIAQNNIEKYGYPDWYYFCIGEWGTKWNARDSVLGNDNKICFDTAWSPPIPVLFKLSQMFPYIKLLMTYTSEQYDFIGRCEIQNGEVDDKIMFHENMITKEGQEFQKEVLGEIIIDTSGMFI